MARRIGIAGSTTHLGGEFKGRLAEAGVPGERVTLLALAESSGILTEYGEEAKVLTDAAEEELTRQDVVCFCGDEETARTYAPIAAQAGVAVIDGTGAWSDDPDAGLTAPAAGRLPDRGEGSIVAVPSGATLLLATLLGPLGEIADGAVATVLLPASEAGDAGIDEMAEQAVGALNLDESVPDEVFGRRLAFDVWTAGSGRSLASSDADVAAQLRRLDLRPPALCLLRAGIFHAVSASLHLPGADAEAVAAALGGAGIELEPSGDDALDSPVRMAGAGGVRLGGCWDDASGGAWTWALIDNLQARAAAMVETVTAWS